ncbi:LIC_10091 family protein [Nannocystis bainbridge]|uniref:DUF7790 domain-containing protein n=1 Tax=Nannocystis bainbridge TaxID=2995303 RepID=A0ABT5E1S9_9BACT|nr:hypothetical protein [Nannocystis bainbridge]MDC0719827.1 hypothetical protein [Nannocystis bainbridge]
MPVPPRPRSLPRLSRGFQRWTPFACGLGLVLTIACGGRPPTEAAPSASAHQSLSAGTSPAPEPTPAPPPRTPAPEPAAPAADPPPGAPAGAGGTAPLTADQRAAMLAGPEDSLIATPIHYMKSNEVRHDVFFPYVAGKGGVYVGVGSDQNYTLAAAAGSELMFLLDIDQSVVDLHRCYEALIEASPDAKILFDRWSAGAVDDSVKILETTYADLPEADRKRIVRLYRAARETVYVHLERVYRRHQGEQPTSWMSNPEMYQYIRGMFLADRVRMMAGDLTGPNSLQSVGAAAKQFGLPVRLVYFSNAEEYFDYNRQFVANVEALIGDEQSLVLRTIYSKKWIHADQLWAYQIQPLTDYRARLGDRKNRSRNPMLRFAELDGTLNKDTGVKGLSLIGLAPRAAG